MEQEGASCCYAKSDKHWTVEAQGLAWEHFHTVGAALEFGSDSETLAGACCIPVRGSELEGSAIREGCCISNKSSSKILFERQQKRRYINPNKRIERDKIRNCTRSIVNLNNKKLK